MNFVAASDESELGASVPVENKAVTVIPATVVCGDCIPKGGYSVAKGDDDDDDSDNNVAPIDRIVFPSDIIDLNPADETIQIVGTRGEKVTRLGKLETALNLKVFRLWCKCSFVCIYIHKIFCKEFNCKGLLSFQN